MRHKQPIHDVRPGQVLNAKLLNEIIDHVNYLMKIRGDGRVFVDGRADAPVIKLAFMPSPILLSKTGSVGLSSATPQVLNLTDRNRATVMASQNVYTGSVLGNVPANTDIVVGLVANEWTVLGWEC